MKAQVHAVLRIEDTSPVSPAILEMILHRMMRGLGVSVVYSRIEMGNGDKHD